MVRAMRDLIVGVFKHLEITSKLDLDLRIKYTEQILRNSAPKKFLHVLLGCKDMDRELFGDQWTLRVKNY